MTVDVFLAAGRRPLRAFRRAVRHHRPGRLVDRPASVPAYGPADYTVRRNGPNENGWGVPFSTADVAAANIDTTALGAIPGDPRSTGRALGRLADQTPPVDGWFLVRLGVTGRGIAATGPKVSRGAQAFAVCHGGSPRTSTTDRSGRTGTATLTTGMRFRSVRIWRWLKRCCCTSSVAASGDR